MKLIFHTRCIIFILVLPCPSEGQQKLPNQLCKSLQSRYLDTVARSVTGYNLRTPSVSQKKRGKSVREFVRGKRENGADWPLYGFAMTGLKRLRNVQSLLEQVLLDQIPGDFMECGVWRGGTSIFALAVFEAFGVTNRSVIMADSFQGLPKARTSLDSNYWSKLAYLQVSEGQVQRNILEFFPDISRVEFVKGFFYESLPTFRIQNLESSRTLAVVRCDGDMYESCFDVILNLYDFIPVGGYFIVDDWGIPVCRRAITDVRQAVGIYETVVDIDGSAVYWRKETLVHMPILELRQRFKKGLTPGSS